MELILVVFCMIAYIKTLEPLCLVAVSILMLAWEVWFCFNRTKDKE